MMQRNLQEIEIDFRQPDAFHGVSDKALINLLALSEAEKLTPTQFRHLFMC
ncbi:MAG: hypothetical protein ABS939_09130 [Psychrobacillus sp.]